MRICSFLPSATEIVCALGLDEKLVGITHECDYPPEVNTKPRVIMSNIANEQLKSKEIDELVKKNKKEGKSTYLVDIAKLKEANPDIILTQGLCEVCAVSGNTVTKAAEALNNKPEIISLEPKTVRDVLNSILVVGEITNKKKTAKKIVDQLTSRIEKIKNSLAKEKDRPRVFCLEWLDPPFVAGHWVPEMVEIAGGENGLCNKGEPSVEVSWEEILDFYPNILFVMPCGFNIDKSLNEIDSVISIPEWHQLPASVKGQVYIVDANSYFSRPSPRIVDGIEILAKTMHPEIFKYSLPADSVLNLRNYMHIQSFLG